MRDTCRWCRISVILCYAGHANGHLAENAGYHAAGLHLESQGGATISAAPTDLLVGAGGTMQSLQATAEPLSPGRVQARGLLFAEARPDDVAGLACDRSLYPRDEAPPITERRCITESLSLVNPNHDSGHDDEEDESSQDEVASVNSMAASDRTVASTVSRVSMERMLRIHSG